MAGVPGLRRPRGPSKPPTKRPAPPPLVKRVPVLVSMPTIPGRERFASKVLNSLISQPVDRILVTLNGPCRRDKLPSHEKITYIQRASGGPGERFRALQGWTCAFLLTVDDDIDYPPDYVSESVRHLCRLGKRSAISYHAHYWETPGPYRTRTTLFLSSERTEYLRVPYGGCGVAAFHGDMIPYLLQKQPAVFRNDDDIWMSAVVRSARRHLVRPPTPARWVSLQSPSPSSTIYGRAKAAGFRERERALQAAEETYLWRREGASPAPQYITITAMVISYNRPEHALALLQDIERERPPGGTLRVRLYEDASSAHYGAPLDFLEKIGGEHFRTPTHYGKPNFWKLVTQTYRDMAWEPSEYFVMLQDDVRLCGQFFSRAVETWEAIKDPHKAAMNIVKELVRGPGPCWTALPPRRVGEVWRSGWVDGLYFASRRYFEGLDFQVSPIPKERFQNPLLGSGVGQDASVRSEKAGRTLYCVDKSLLAIRQVKSQMNPEERERTPMRATDYIDGEDACRRLEE